MSNVISISVLAEAKKARQELESVNGSLGKMGGFLKKAAGGLVAFAAVGKAVSFVKDQVKDSVRAGSDLQQSTGAVEAVFGKQAGQIKKFAASADQSLGLSRNSYQELASVLGAGFKNQGIKDFAGETQNVIGLGADLAAQFGGSTTQAVEAIGSLMRGEADPIEKYGVSIKDSAIAAELASKGQDKLKGSALEQAKAQARLSLLFKQSKDAQGAFARESGSLANIQQRNAAATENLKAKIGTAFLPILTQLYGWIGNKVIPVLSRFADFLIARIPSAVETVKGVLSGLKQAFNFGGDGGGLSTYVTGLKALFTTIGPIIRTVLTTVVGAIRENLPAIKQYLSDIGTAFSTAAQIIRIVWGAVGPFILKGIKIAITLVVGVLSGFAQILKGIMQVVSGVLRGDWSAAWQGVVNIARGNGKIVSSLVKGIFNFIKNTWSGIQRVTASIWRAIGNAILRAISAAGNAVRSRAQAIKSSIQSAWNSAKSATTSAWNSLVNTIRSKVSSAVSTARQLPSRIRGALSGMAGYLRSAGSSLIQGFIGGILSGISGAISAARRVAQSAISAAKSALSINSPSKVFVEIGKYTAQGLAQGIDRNSGLATRAATRLSDGLTDSFGGPSLNLNTSSLYGAPTASAPVQVIVNFNGLVTDPVATGKAVVDAANRYLKMNGYATI